MKNKALHIKKTSPKIVPQQPQKLRISDTEKAGKVDRKEGVRDYN